MFRNPRYVIAVKDLRHSASFYRDILGFEIVETPDPGWLFYVRGQCFIMAGECVGALPPSDLGDHSYFAYVEVDDIREFHDVLIGRGVELVKPLTSEPWDMLEFGIKTADGHRIMFASPVAGG